MKNIITLLTLFLPNLGFSASFDCSKASTSVEKMICQNSKLNKLDERMAEVYKEVRKLDQSVIASQKEWLKEVRSCRDEKCLENSYAIRVEELENTWAKLDRSNLQKNSSSENSSSQESIDIKALFSQGGYWAQGQKINQSNLDCRALSSLEDVVFTRYDTNSATKYIPKMKMELRSTSTYNDFKQKGNSIFFNRTEKFNNGALMQAYYELDNGKKILKLIRSVSCIKCAESQQMAHNINLNGGPTEYWCNGNFK